MRTSTVVILALLGAVAGAREAAANSCNAYTPFFANGLLPIGCPMVVAVHSDATGIFGNREVTAWRGSPGQETRVPLTATVSEERRTFGVQITTWDDDDCEEHSVIEPTSYVVYTVVAQDAVVGDRLEIGGQGGPFVAAAGPCPAVEEPFFYCQEPIQDCPADDDAEVDGVGGCSAGGGGGAGGAAGLTGIAMALGILARRRR